MKVKLSLVIIVSLLISSIPYNPTLVSSNSNFPDDRSNFDSTSFFNTTDSTTNIVSQTPIKSLNTETWYLGESIKTKILFNKQGIDYSDTILYGNEANHQESEISGYGNEFSDDDKPLTFKTFFDSSLSGTQRDRYILTRIYCGGSGILYYDGQAAAGPDLFSLTSSGTVSGTLTVTSDMLDSQGYLYIRIKYSAKEGTSPDQDVVEFYIYYITNNGETLLDSAQNSGELYTSFSLLFASLDVLYFQRDTIENIVRSNYQYGSSMVVTHKINVPSVPRAQKIEIYYPTSWSYSSITPSASVSDASTILTISSPTELTYTVFFTSNSTYFLAIEDITCQYLQDVGFEGGTYSDLSSLVEPFDSYDVTTDIVSEGYFSCKMSDSESAGSDGFNLEIGYRGGLYLSFDYYLLDGYTWTDLRVYYRVSDTSWDYISVGLGETNRWNKVFVYFELKGNEATNNRNVIISFRSGYGTVYLDNIHLFIVSTQVQTLSPNKHKISSTFRVWDGYKNPTISNIPVTMSMYKRNYAYSDARTFDTYSYFVANDLQTDENGIVTYTYEGVLEQTELVILVFSPESNFYYAFETNVDAYGFVPGYNIDDWYMDGDVLVIEGHTSLVSGIYRFTYSFDFTDMYLNEFSVILYDMKINTTNDINNIYHREVFDGSSAYPYHTTYVGNPYDPCAYPTDWKSSWSVFGFWGSFHSINCHETLNEEYISTHVFRSISAGVVSNTDGQSYKISYRNIKLIQAQAYLFTPSYPSHTDYAETVLDDAWDWTEGDTESVLKNGQTANYPIVVENGYIEYIAYDEWDGIKFHYSRIPNLSIDTSYWNYFVFRAKGNVSYSDYWAIWFGYNGNYEIALYPSDGLYDCDLYSDWHIYSFDLTLDSAYEGQTINEIRIHAYAGASNAQIQIDYVIFAHVDGFLSQTNDFFTDELHDAIDYEEGDDEDRDPNNDWGTETIQNGVSHLDSEYWSTYDRSLVTWQYGSGGGDPVNLNLDTSTYYYVVFNLRTNIPDTSGNTLVFWETEDGVFRYIKFDVVNNGKWHIYELNLSSYSSWFGHVRRFGISLSMPDNTGVTNFYAELDYLRVLSYNTLPYNTIQNSVLLESENNTLTYATYIDSKYIGNFQDLSLIPLNTSVGIHTFSVQPFKTDRAYITQNIYTYFYTIDAPTFYVNVQSFYLSDLYVNLYVTSNYDGTYTIVSGGTGSGTLYKEGTTITVARDTTPGATIHFVVQFTYNSETVTFETYYTNPSTDFYVTDYRISETDTQVTLTWDTSKSSTDQVVIYQDDNLVGTYTTSPVAITKSSVVGTHHLTFVFQETSGNYGDIIYTYSYTVQATEAFVVNVQSFYLSDTYVNTYVTSNYDGTYTVYENNTQIASGSFLATGTAIVTTRSQQVGTIFYAIKFVYNTEVVWFNSSYSNAAPEPQPNYVTFLDYSVDIEAETIYINLQTFWANQTVRVADNGTWLGDYKNEGSSYWSFTASYGFHNISIHVYNGLAEQWLFSFGFTVQAPTVEPFIVNVQSFYLSDTYVNTYVTSNYDYSYTIYTNGTIIGTGTGLAVGTTIIAPKKQDAGLYNFTIVFTHNTENVTFTAWYSVLKLPPEPQNTIYREQTSGNYTVIIDTNIDNFWVRLYHDNEEVGTYHNQNVLVVEKKLAVGWHNISFDFIYNVSTNEEGYPCDPYNITLHYGPFTYETKLFYEVAIRYITLEDGLAVSDFSVDSVLTYLDGQLVQAAQNLTIPEYANYSYIFNNRIWIRNTMPIHTLTVTDLLNRTILEQTIDISKLKYAIIQLPLERLTIVNLDDEAHKVKISPLADDNYFFKELAPGQAVTYWIKNGSYTGTVYALQTYTDSNGIIQRIWIEQSQQRFSVPFTFTIPLQVLSSTIEQQEQSFFDRYSLWIILGAILVAVLSISFAINKLKEWNARLYLRALQQNRTKEAALRSLFISADEKRGMSIALKQSQKANKVKRK